MFGSGKSRIYCRNLFWNFHFAKDCPQNSDLNSIEGLKDDSVPRHQCEIFTVIGGEFFSSYSSSISSIHYTFLFSLSHYIFVFIFLFFSLFLYTSFSLFPYTSFFSLFYINLSLLLLLLRE